MSLMPIYPRKSVAMISAGSTFPVAIDLTPAAEPIVDVVGHDASTMPVEPFIPAIPQAPIVNTVPFMQNLPSIYPSTPIYNQPAQFYPNIEYRPVGKSYY